MILFYLIKMDSVNIDTKMDFSNIKNKESETKTTRADTKSDNKDKSDNEDKSEDKSDNEAKSEFNLCEAFKKDKKRCTKKSTGIFKNKCYCNVHLKQQSIGSNEDKSEFNLCEAFKKDKKRCTKKSTGKFKNKCYCNVHLKQQSKEASEEANISYNCEGIKKDGDRCNKKGIENTVGKLYCKVHFNQIKKESIKEKLNKEKIIIKEFNKFIKTKIKHKYSCDEFKAIKDTYKKFMLILHPDKCKMYNINCNELTVILNNYMDEIKYSFER